MQDAITPKRQKKKPIRAVDSHCKKEARPPAACIVPTPGMMVPNHDIAYGTSQHAKVGKAAIKGMKRQGSTMVIPA